MKKNFILKYFFLCVIGLVSSVLMGQISTFDYSGSMVSYTVPPGVSIITIEALGGQGASGDNSYVGGKGARMSGEFAVVPGDELIIVVGGMGQGQGSGSNGGGGGGSFVVAADPGSPYTIASGPFAGTNVTPLIIAGGGGGTRVSVDADGNPGVISEQGTTGSGYSRTGGGAPNTSALGNGGIVSSDSWGSAGGGFIGNGQNDTGYGAGGYSFLNGAAGGNVTGCNHAATGGFGAGGQGRGCNGGGGGGGYTGGDGGRVAGGGGSYNIGANQSNESGYNEGDGQVVITVLCSETPLDIVVSPATTVCPGTMVTLTATSANGGTITWDNGITNGVAFEATTTTIYNAISDHPSDCPGSARIRVEDNDAPIPDIPNLTDLTAECSVSAPTAPTATDLCAGAITGTTTTVFPITAVGLTTITWNYDDGNGNVSTQTQNVIVTDMEAPVPDVSDLPVIYRQCSAVITDVPTATDNCEGTIIGITYDPTTYLNQGTYTLTWVYNDGNGNVSSQDQTVVISDVYAPTPDLDTLPVLTGECSVNISTLPLAWDNCAGPLDGTTSSPFSYTEQGSFLVTWTYDDGNGNITTQGQMVIVDDVTAPVADVSELPDITAECSVTLTAPTATDNCEGSIVATTDEPLSYNEEGTYVVMWTYNDGNGNSSSQTQNVIIDDVTDPIPDVTTLPDLTGVCSVVVTTIPTATDNCTGSISATTTDPLTYDAAGSYTVTWTYDDGNGNVVTQTQTVIVEDISAPVPDITDLPAVTAECSVTLVPPTATDDCMGTINGTTEQLSFDELGTTTVTWTYDDGNGNTATQTQSVTVQDITPPVPDIADLTDITAECGAYLTNTPPEATDNCGGTIIGTTDITEVLEQGTTTVTWTYDDGNGNISTQTQTVIIDDVSAPTGTCPDDAITCDGTVSDISLTDVSDNCTTVDVTYELTGATTASGNTDASSETFNVGVTTVTYTLSDQNGNSSDCSFTVTYTDGIEIPLSGAGNEIVTTAEGTYQWINCADNSIITGATSASLAPDESGSYAVIVTQGACVDTSDCFQIDILGLNKNVLTQEIEVFPNPVSDVLTIDLISLQTNVRINIVNMAGQTVYSRELKNLQKTDIDVSELSHGVYFIHVDSDQATGIVRIVKE